MKRRLVVIGDSLLDTDLDGTANRLVPDSPAPVLDGLGESVRPGGAALAAVMARSDGENVALVTGIAEDEAGERLRGLILDAGIELIDLGLAGPTPEKIRVRAAGKVICRLDRGCEAYGALGPVVDRVAAVLQQADSMLVADYGRGMTSHHQLRQQLREHAPYKPIVWDPHPRGSAPVADTRLATPNHSEAAGFTPDIAGQSLSAWTARARELKATWRAANIAVTMSGRGALLVSGDSPPVVVPAEPAQGDACGAGDRFSTAAAIALMHGRLPSEAVAYSVELASHYVSAGGVSTVAGLGATAAARQDLKALPGAQQVVDAVRSKGGTVVATGGCFDLLHTGHVQTLKAARALGDCLIVALNSDRSVAKLKGPDRPLTPQAERAALLEALTCVDAVVTFDDSTPEQVLQSFKPDVFVKGGDYAFTEIPEERVLQGWGGQVVTLPYLKGRSTSALIDKIAAGAQD